MSRVWQMWMCCLLARPSCRITIFFAGRVWLLSDFCLLHMLSIVSSAWFPAPTPCIILACKSLEADMNASYNSATSGHSTQCLERPQHSRTVQAYMWTQAYLAQSVLWKGAAVHADINKPSYQHNKQSDIGWLHHHC